MRQSLPLYRESLLAISKIVRFGLLTLSLLSIRESSALPVKISLYPGYENHILLVRSTLFPKFRFPCNRPILETSFHRKGNNNSRLLADESLQNRSFSLVVSLTYFSLEIKSGSAPENNSCQRRPSKVINTTFVLSFCAWHVPKPNKNSAIKMLKTDSNVHYL